MAKPVLNIELDPGPWKDPKWADHRATGGRFSGRVIMSSDEAVTCRKLFVRVGWITEGRGDTNTEHCFETTLFEGQVPLNETSYEFSCVLPLGPMSYSGHYINIMWQVHAQLDLSWRVDPKATKQFFLTVP